MLSAGRIGPCLIMAHCASVILQPLLVPHLSQVGPFCHPRWCFRAGRWLPRSQTSFFLLRLIYIISIYLPNLIQYFTFMGFWGPCCAWSLLFILVCRQRGPIRVACRCTRWHYLLLSGPLLAALWHGTPRSLGWSLLSYWGPEVCGSTSPWRLPRLAIEEKRG